MGPVKWYFDTSVLVAAAATQHPHNIRALAVLEELISRKHDGYLSAHSLTETYSVLTRIPFKPPLHPRDAWQILEAMIFPHMELLTLTPKEYRDVVHNCAVSGWTGGKVHDAVHLRCARKVGADRIYTFNVKDFKALAPPDLADKVSAP